MHCGSELPDGPDAGTDEGGLSGMLSIASVSPPPSAPPGMINWSAVTACGMPDGTTGLSVEAKGRSQRRSPPHSPAPATV
eukprot:scaffold40421_cov39-Prasinocladus_malaysianus.AAC.1